MNKYLDDERTICALITSPGEGAIGVIRVSGKDAAQITRKTCDFLPDELRSHTVYYGYARDGDGQKLDEVLVSYFAKGRSYTGEECFEISVHGNSLIVESMITELQKNGCRFALGGEFTFRAFLNGRLDLVQAESVLSLIQSRSKKAVNLSLNQLGKKLSVVLAEIEKDLVWCLANVEAGIDFSHEDIDVFEKNELIERLKNTHKRVGGLRQTYEGTRIAYDGIEVGIVGRTNVGKSSLLNALCFEEKAIVTDIEGTTRDIVQGEIQHNGQLIKLYDTAGLRNRPDDVEKLGIEKTIKKAESVKVVLFVVDVDIDAAKEAIEEFEKIRSEDVIIVMNKTDLKSPSWDGATSLQLATGRKVHPVSAKNRTGLDEILNSITNRYVVDENRDVIFQARHKELLRNCHELIEKTINGIEEGLSFEFSAMDLRESLNEIQEILGKTYNDEILNTIFSEFCIGK
jgi:tRNA modification GTPase